MELTPTLILNLALLIVPLYIEAEHFETMTREFTFSDTRKSITVTGLKAYSADPTQNPDGYADDVNSRVMVSKCSASI